MTVDMTWPPHHLLAVVCEKRKMSNLGLLAFFVSFHRRNYLSAASILSRSSNATLLCCLT